MKPVTAETVQAEIRRLEDFTACTTRPLSLTEEFHLQCLRQLLSVLNPAPQIDNDGWMEWGGGEMPVPENTEIDFICRDGEQGHNYEAREIGWFHDGAGDDIIAYRVIENDGREG